MITNAAILNIRKPLTHQLDATNAITRYYDIYHKLYLHIWGNYDNLSLHCGYYENDEVQSHDESIIKMNKFIANLAEIKKADVILDAGCGVGGSSIWFAQHYGARIIGISLSRKEISSAKKFAKQKSVSNVEFEVMNYHDTKFDSETFDTILGIESFCYSLDKKRLINECFRLLNNANGKIVIADYFQTDNITTDEQWRGIQRINEDYSVELCSMMQLKENLGSFECIEIYDVTSNVRRSYIEGLKRIKSTFSVTKSKVSKQYIRKEFNRVAHEFKCLQEGGLKYGVIFAEKRSKS